MEKVYSQTEVDKGILDEQEGCRGQIEKNLSRELGSFLLSTGVIGITQEDYINMYTDSYLMKATIITATEEEFKEYKAMKRFFEENTLANAAFEVWKERRKEVNQHTK